MDGTLLQFVVIARPMTALGTLFSRTTLLEISPRYVIVNKCAEEVQVQQAGWCSTLQFQGCLYIL